MINIADLPAVRAQLERDTASAGEMPAEEAAPQYARAPDGPSVQITGSRPAATQESSR